MTMRTVLPTATLLLLLGCSQHQDDTTTILPQPTITCRLASYEEATSIQGQGVAGTSRATYQASFDTNGQLTSATSSDKTQAATNSFESQATTRFQYDAAGFLQQSVTTTQITSTYGSTSATSNYTETSQFSYTNNRLSTALHRSVGGSSGTTSRSTKIETYQYDSQGRLSQYTATDSAGQSMLVYTYSGGQLSRVTQDGRDQYTIEQGRITGSTTGFTKSYDAKGRLTGTRSNGLSTKYDYAEGGQSVLLAYPEFRFKGMPFEALFQVQGGADLDGLVQRETQYQETNGSRKKVDETIRTFELNAQGLPTRQSSTRTVSGSGSRTEQGTALYTYRDCQWKPI